MEELVQHLNSSLTSGSLVAFLIMFGTGITLAFNPCMAAMAPLVIGGSRQTGFGRSLLFMGGFTITLMILGLAAASLGKVLTLPAWFWTSALGILYLITGMILLQTRLPFRVSSFYVFREQPRWLDTVFTKEGLNPAALGAVFALAPSPCTLPVIMAVTAFVLASGQMLFGSFALGFFALGHSLPLALAFLPWVRNLFRPNPLTRALRPALGVLMIALALYFLVAHPDFFSQNSMTFHR
ncbi:thiol:disulfide interchange protein DsbD precursor [Peptococcaceae bacterium CEB3]|nr:thiol:disulfide interchange protein DsbD precursor [Peptococcaceae bacterium CEB3]